MSVYELHHGDCLDLLRGMADNSVDSIVTDPPYGLSFMGKKWDYDVPSVDVWRECLRVLKPGGHLLAFAGTRTQHRMAVRIEDAGFEIRDMIAWVYGSGFPKSLDVSKAIDKAAGAEREVIGFDPTCRLAVNKNMNDDGWEKIGQQGAPITAPATDAARQWQGWGTALKPALEPITVARKPLVGTVAENVLAHGTGALNIDGCRVGTESTLRVKAGGANQFPHEDDSWVPKTVMAGCESGRWPANLIHDGHPDVVAPFPCEADGVAPVRGVPVAAAHGFTAADLGSSARFFYCAKPDREDRDAGLHGREQAKTGDGRKVDCDNPFQRGATLRSNTHPTVKPTDLMRYLCRLVTPPGGTVLDPFNGSGSTGKGAVLEGFRYIGMDREAEYLEISRARIEHALLLAKAGADVLKPATARDARTLDLFGAAG